MLGQCLPAYIPAYVFRDMPDILLPETTPDPALPSRSLRSTIHVLLWTFFLLACYLLAWSRVTSNARYWADCRAQKAKQKEMMERGKQRFYEIHAFLCKRPLTRKEIEAQLNGGRAFVLQRRGELGVTTWIEPVYGVKCELEFKDDACVEHTIHFRRSTAASRYPNPDRVDYQGRSEVICRWISELVQAFWVPMVALTALGARYRRPLAELLLAAAILCAIAQAVNLHYAASVEDIFNNDPLFYGAVMLVVSVAIFALVAPQPGRLQFHLRTMLCVMTLLAALCSLGPFGFVGVAAALVGLVEYLVVSRAVTKRGRPPAPG
jgi:hypothetical protein